MRKHFQAPWGIKDILFVVITSAFLILLLIFLLNYFGIYEYIDGLERQGLIMSGLVVLQWILIAIPVVFITLHNKFKFSDSYLFYKEYNRNED